MHRLIAVFMILLGVNFLLENFGVDMFDVGDLTKFWPLVLVWLGYTMWRDGERKNRPE